MTRSIATTRSVANLRSVATPRSATNSYRVPIGILNLGVTNMWDFRTGFNGTNLATVADMIDGLNLSWYGTTALSSVYSAGKYQIDIRRASSDYFRSGPRPIAWNALLTSFAWVKRSSTATIQTILSHWETASNRRGFFLRINAANNIELSISFNGTSQAIYTSTQTLTDTSSYHFIVATYNTTDRCKIYLDGVALNVSLTAGSNPAFINGSDISFLVGANVPSSPSNIYDGIVGLCGVCVGKSMTEDEATRLYNLTRAVGRYA